MRSIPQTFGPLPPTSTTITAYPDQNMVQSGLSLATPPSTLIAQNQKSKPFCPINIPKATLAMALSIAQRLRSSIMSQSFQMMQYTL